ncbi:hypothetical protein AOQ84DRAFT_164111 [Glonium stellatum]|uniref:Uncharacterized protein n=1 Tax=Glonium stellatum TaxID=574774 RepID=A0A8E2F896_9PEZI|nr:hypothetical protein AOQ84DRAFT_164111 [Glonium stellatum]
MLLQASAKEGSQLSSSSLSTADDDDQVPSTNISDPSLNSFEEMMQNERVAELEKALAVARGEQKAMTDEIERLRNHETVYRDAMEGYKQQLSDEQVQRYSLHSTSGLKEFEQETDRRRSWGKERAELQEQIYELQGKVTELQSDILDRDAMWKVQWERERTDRIMERNQLAESLHAAEKEAQDRRKQLLDLKQSISALTRMDSQVTDSELAERMDQLYHRIREWVISNFRRSKLDFSNIRRETAEALEAIYPEYVKTQPSDKIGLYQAIVLSSVMKIFNEKVCVGLPEDGPLARVRELATYLQENQTLEFREWRRCTIRALEKGRARQVLNEQTQLLIRDITKEIQEIMANVSGVNPTEASQSSLVSILQAVVELQRIFLTQKAEYVTTLIVAQNGVAFDESRIEFVNIEDEDIMQGRIAFFVFPVLEKYGDESGENTSVRNVLFKARVFCQADIEI